MKRHLDAGHAPEDVLVLVPSWDDQAEVVLETLGASGREPGWGA